MLLRLQTSEFIHIRNKKMDKNYIKYSVSELLDDQEFIRFIKFGSRKREWEALIRSSKIFEKKVQEARKVIEIAARDIHEFSDDEIREQWQAIGKFEVSFSRMHRRKKYLVFMRYAAALVLMFAIGSISLRYLMRSTENYTFSNKEISRVDKEAKLILQNGKEIVLEKDHSSIKVEKTGDIQIDEQEPLKIETVKGETSSKMNEVVVPYGKQSQLRLSDGTRIWLNAGSRLAFPSEFTGKKREVFLEGEAYFEVARNESQAFHVNINDVSVKVLGTKFNISANQDDPFVQTVLLEGSVGIEFRSFMGLSGKSVILEPNQMASIQLEQKQITVDEISNASDYIAWTHGWMLFSRESVISVINKVKRYYNVEFKTINKLESNELITGKLELKESIEEVMSTLREVAKINYTFSGDTIIIEKIEKTEN